MSRRTPLAALAASAAVLAVGLPSTANAASSATAQKQVGAHLEKAQVAAKRVARYTRLGNESAALKALKTSRREAVAASRGARQIAAGAGDSTTAAKNAVWSITASAGTLGDALKLFASLVPKADDPALQQSLANALPGTAAGHAQLVQELSDIVDELSGSAQAIAAQALAAIQATAPDQVQQIADVAGITDLPTKVSTIIQTALSTATAALKTGIQQLANVLPALPDQTETKVNTALGSITSMVHDLIPAITNITDIVTTTATQAIKSALSMVTNVFGGLTDGLFGTTKASAGTSQSGSTPATTTPATTTPAPASSGGLLGGLLNFPLSLPKGILGGLSGLLGSTTGLLGGLFG